MRKRRAISGIARFICSWRRSPRRVRSVGARRLRRNFTIRSRRESLLIRPSLVACVCADLGLGGSLTGGRPVLTRWPPRRFLPARGLRRDPVERSDVVMPRCGLVRIPLGRGWGARDRDTPGANGSAPRHRRRHRRSGPCRRPGDTDRCSAPALMEAGPMGSVRRRTDRTSGVDDRPSGRAGLGRLDFGRGDRERVRGVGPCDDRGRLRRGCCTDVRMADRGCGSAAPLMPYCEP